MLKKLIIIIFFYVLYSDITAIDQSELILFQILTKDSVTVAVDAVVYYRIQNPMISVCNVEDASRSTRLLAQTTLRNILGTKTLSEILTDREQISQTMQVKFAFASRNLLHEDSRCITFN